MWDILMWQTNVDKQAFIHNEKLEFIRQYKDVIKDAANEYDIPILLMAGVVYKEYGGDPMFVDHGIYMIRGWELESLGGPIFDFMDDKLGIYRGEEYTSFGNVSIQLRRVCESLGLNYGELRRDVVDEIVLSCKDPVENIYIAAKHLSDLRDMQYPGLSGDDMQDEEIIIIGTRYNRGPDLTLEEINENTSYGTEMLINKEEIEKALEE